MNLKKYFKVGARLMKANVMTEMIYRANFFFGSFTTVMYFVIQLVYIYYLFESGGATEIGGFSREEVYFVMVCHQLVMAIFFAFIIDNLSSIIEKAHKGQLDFLMLKPIRPTFLMFNQETRLFGPLSMLIYSVMTMAALLYRGNIIIEPSMFWMIILIMVLSIILMHSLYLIGTSVFFWYNEFWALWDVIHEFQEIVKYPKSVYPAIMRFVLLFILPMFNIINPIYGILRHEPSWGIILNLLIVNIIFGGIAWTMWIYGLRRYSSAA
jgi:ABC-2 type transport system permease protein